MTKFPFQTNYSKLPERFFAHADADRVPAPQLIAFNKPLAGELGIGDADEETLAYVFTGQNLPETATPIALAYAGHQFGHFVPQLGDGRALMIGELASASGQLYDVQLKGSGRTVFSRGGDGKSPLGPVIREYLVSEAMHRLGVPTTRALAAATTGERIRRGHEVSPGAIFTRVASSHIRVGTFEFFAARRDTDALQLLMEYAIERHYPDLEPRDPIAFLERVVEAIASLVAKWMSLGFIHGVMNTDNTSIAGETIDYGPCAFMDEFRFDQVYSSIDHGGRYAYEQQPKIAQWNCARLADCLSLLVGEMGFHKVDGMRKAIEEMPSIYQRHLLSEMRPKLGLTSPMDDDDQLITAWLEVLQREALDFTNSFRMLSSTLEGPSPFPPTTNDFLARWKKRVTEQAHDLPEIEQAMNRANPVHIPRNHLVEKAIRQGIEGDYTFFRHLQKVLDTPFSLQDENLTTLPSEEERVRETFCGT